MVSHGLISALMFLIVGSIYERTQTTQIDQLRRTREIMPFISGILLIAGMASLGLPGLSGFISEFFAFLGLFETHRVYAIIGTLGIIFTAVYVLRGVLNITFGPMQRAYSARHARRAINRGGADDYIGGVYSLARCIPKRAESAASANDRQLGSIDPKRSREDRRLDRWNR